MSSVTFGAVAALLTFITPALPAFIVYRYYYPRSKTLPANEGILLVTSALFTWLVNGVLISKYTSRLLSSFPEGVETKSFKALSSIFKFYIDDHGWRDFFYYWAGEPVSDSFWLFTIQLHIRAIVFSFIILKLARAPGWFEKKAQLAPYKKRKSIFHYYDCFLIWLGDGDSSEDPEQYERKRIQFKWLSSWRDAFLEPWARLTLSNRQREVLMVDVLTKSDNLYSGFLTSYVLKENDLSAIVMDYAFRFSSLEKIGEKYRRRKDLIKSNGELIIQGSEIETIHFWEIRLGTTVEVYVQNINDSEKLKWYIVLRHVFPDFITGIKVLFELSSQEAISVLDDLEEWAASSGMMAVYNDLHIGLSPDLEQVVHKELEELETKQPEATPPPNH